MNLIEADVPPHFEPARMERAAVRG